MNQSDERLFVYPVISYRVIDGDSIEVVMDLGFSQTLKMSCRIDGIDTPEVKTKAGKRVKEVVSLTLSKLREPSVYVVSFGPGKFAGRFLGDIRTHSGFSLSSMLLSNELANVYNGRVKQEFDSDRLSEIENRCNEILGAK